MNRRSLPLIMLFRDGEAGLDFAQARSYQGRTGRFSTVDPIYAGLFAPQAWNRYAYARNAPVPYTDANGLLAEAIRVTSTPGCESFPAMCEMERRRQADENASWPSGAGFDIPNATWSPQPRGRGVDLGGTPPPPPPPPIFQPQPSVPAPAPSPPPVADECRVVANSIAGLGLISHFDPLGNTMTAVMLFSVKEPDPWNGRPHGAFRTSLTDPRQGDDVYRHLYFMSSSVMGSPAHAGAGLSLLGSDLRQLVFNTLGIGEPHESAIAEVRDDIAGMAAGVIAKVGAFSPSASARLITKVICK